VSEEEKLRKLCGYSVNAVRLPESHEGVSAAANTVSEEEKLRKLCGYSVNAVRLPGNNLKESPPQRTQRARRKNSRLEA
jgi:hypothetical protein